MSLYNNILTCTPTHTYLYIKNKYLFSLFKGDGIEFKKIFRRIRELLADISCKPPSIQ